MSDAENPDRMSEQLIFTGEFLDSYPGGVTIERPDPPQPYDPTGRLGTIVTVAGEGRFIIIEQLLDQQWLANKLPEMPVP